MSSDPIFGDAASSMLNKRNCDRQNEYEILHQSALWHSNFRFWNTDEKISARVSNGFPTAAPQPFAPAISWISDVGGFSGTSYPHQATEG
jgi:hypothetical protein